MLLAPITCSRNSPIRLIVLPLEACVAEIIKLKPPFERPSWTFYSNIYIMSTIPYNYTQATERNSEARSTSVTVQISVLDINDNAPLFEFQSYEVNVTESAQMGYSVLNLTATDSDEVRMQGLNFSFIKMCPLSREFLATSSSLLAQRFLLVFLPSYFKTPVPAPVAQL